MLADVPPTPSGTGPDPEGAGNPILTGTGDESDTGHCSCGRVGFEISEPLVAAAACYCTRCQRRTGTGTAVNGMARPGSFGITADEELVRSFTPEDGWEKALRSNCGGHLYACDPNDPDRLAVRLGAVDGDPGVRPGGHRLTDYAVPWALPPDDGLPHFPERLDWSEVVHPG